ncbi:MAG: hypothetical protein ACXWID_12850 [Pyrinomonadaceae bacterium]
MVNPARALARQFVRRSPTTWLGIGVALSVVDFATLYVAAVRDGVLYIDQGIGLLNHYGLLSTIVGNAIALYTAKKYYDGVRSITDSKAVVKGAALKQPLKDLQEMVELRGKPQFLMYFFLVLGVYFWASNFSTHIFGDPVAKWGHVLDSKAHTWSFLAGRLHNIYTWIVIMPYVAHVMIWSFIQLWMAMKIALKERALKYDLLNPDHCGGFGFVYNALIAFNVVLALVVIEVTAHSATFGRLNFEHIANYTILTVLLLGINNLFFAYMYGPIKRLRMESLNNVKDEVFKNNNLSLEILKYCYERRVSTLSIANLFVQASTIAIPGIVKYWPAIVKVIRA